MSSKLNAYGFGLLYYSEFDSIKRFCAEEGLSEVGAVALEGLGEAACMVMRMSIVISPGFHSPSIAHLCNCGISCRPSG